MCRFVAIFFVLVVSDLTVGCQKPLSDPSPTLKAGAPAQIEGDTSDGGQASDEDPARVNGPEFVVEESDPNLPLPHEADVELLELTTESELFDISSHHSIFNSMMTTVLERGTLLDLEEESRGRYSATERQLGRCREIPIASVWREFSPFFGYRWDSEFESFAQLFLTIWKRESNYKPPRRGVLVQPNCKSRGAKLIKALKAKDVGTDLAHARAKNKKIREMYPGCNLALADFGALQWNYHWRLKRSVYRTQIERALLLSSSYKKSDLKGLSNVEIANLVKYNPMALFILGGLDFKRSLHDPERVIREYNTNPKYHSMAMRNYSQIGKVLQRNADCVPTWTKGR
jgi:hypothetical protein